MVRMAFFKKKIILNSRRQCYMVVDIILYFNDYLKCFFIDSKNMENIGFFVIIEN